MSSLNNLGNSFADLGDTRRAIQFYDQQLSIARETGDRRGENAALGNLGSAYADLGETERAIQFYEQALLTDREIGDLRGEGADLWNLSLALDRLGKRDQAIQYAEQSLAILAHLEDPYAAKVRAKLAAWREESGHN